MPRAAAALAALVFLLACRPMQAPYPGAGRLLELPPNERYDLFLQYPLEQQVVLYVWVMHAVHPPDLGFSEALARNGTPVVPYLLERMRASRAGFDIFSLVNVFLLMHLNGCFDARSAAGVMEEIRSSVEGSDDSAYKKESLSVLRELETRPFNALRAKGRCRSNETPAETSKFPLG